MIVAAIALFIIVHAALYHRLWRKLMNAQELLAKATALNTDVDAIVASEAALIASNATLTQEKAALEAEIAAGAGDQVTMQQVGDLLDAVTVKLAPPAV